MRDIPKKAAEKLLSITEEAFGGKKGRFKINRGLLSKMVGLKRWIKDSELQKTEDILVEGKESWHLLIYKEDVYMLPVVENIRQAPKRLLSEDEAEGEAE